MSTIASAGGQNRRVGRKVSKNGFGALKREIEQGLRFFYNNRPVHRPSVGRPKKEKEETP